MFHLNLSCLTSFSFVSSLGIWSAGEDEATNDNWKDITTTKYQLWVSFHWSYGISWIVNRQIQTLTRKVAVKLCLRRPVVNKTRAISRVHYSKAVNHGILIVSKNYRLKPTA